VTEWLWIEVDEAIVIHGLLLAEHGGPAGIRDRGLLISALARPKQRANYGSADVHTLASLYSGGIVRNHPFVDGNKRTGFLIGILFLELNGYRFRATEEDATRAMVALAAGELSEEEFARFLSSNSTRA
jgi:death on curing protein